MSAKTKTEKQPAKTSSDKSQKRSGNDDLDEDGDISTPKRDFNEDEIKEEEDKRL